MKAEKIIKGLIEINSEAYSRWVHRRSDDKLIDMIGEYVGDAIKLLEKQTPKKVTHEATRKICPTCPSCKNVVGEVDKFEDKPVLTTWMYCKYCGQKLDWENS